MSSAPNKDVAAIDDARALIDALLENGWQEVHICDGETEIFIARDGAGFNPMRGMSEPQLPPPTTVSDARKVIVSPHVATVVWVQAAGTTVASGDPVARLSVLEDEEIISASKAARVIDVMVHSGTLVEYGSPLLELEETP